MVKATNLKLVSMRKIVYYVASSLDGYIAGPNESIDGFVTGGAGVEQYLQDLQAFEVAIMGRNTYEFGYRFGMQPGQAPYPHMQHYIFSNSLVLHDPAPNIHIQALDVAFIQKLKQSPGGDIYLCGGGLFAGWLLDHELIDILKIKLNPLILGQGVRLFGHSNKAVQPKLIEQSSYDQGLQILTYQLVY